MVRTPSRNKLETESSSYPESGTGTLISESTIDQIVPKKLEKPLRIQDLSTIPLRSEIRKLQFEVERWKKDFRNLELTSQSTINQLERENGAARSERIDLENELIACQSRVDQLKFEKQLLSSKEQKFKSDLFQEKNKYELLTKQKKALEKENNVLKKCKIPN